MSFFSWTEITSFHNIRKYTKSYPEILNENSVVDYKCKVKLHGTNAAVQCHSNGFVIAQSREKELINGADNCGFAKFIKDNETYWNLKNDLVIFGEWVGPGVQVGVAISNIPKKSFVIFAARSMADNSDSIIIEPDDLQKLVSGIPDTYVLPWYEQMPVDWNKSSDDLQVNVNSINVLVEIIEANDPWVESIFNIKGTGEGLVFYPTSKDHLGLKNFNNLIFKAKGEKHKNIKKAAPAQIDASTAQNINEFVNIVLTQSRLEQGAKAIMTDQEFDTKLVGKFINWISADVQKETQDELAASNLTYKSVQKQLLDSSRSWYLEQCKKL